MKTNAKWYTGMPVDKMSPETGSLVPGMPSYKTSSSGS